jgi:GNAT superfamily N-acetyltransferase
MSRPGLMPRIARREDAPELAELWSDVLRRVDRSEQIADLELIIKSAAESPEQRFVVVEHDGHVAGAVFLRLSTVTPINLEPCVQSVQPRVFVAYRRRGVGRMLMEAAAVFAEENGVLHMTTAVPATARDANRFMARLALGPYAVLRLAPAGMVQAKLDAQTPSVGLAGGRSGARQLTHVLAARRSSRRAQRRGVTDVQG